MYGAFSKREAMVTKLSTRAGTPPSAVALLQRAQAAGFLSGLDEFVSDWETWLVELEETHTSLAALSFSGHRIPIGPG